MTKLLYYKDFDFGCLVYMKGIKSHLGSMMKYQYKKESSQGIRLQFPKVNIVKIDENVVTLGFNENNKGLHFFQKLKDMNDSKIRKKGLIAFNGNGPISMKVNENTLYFTEDSCITTLNETKRLVENKTECKVVVIASSEGLWTTETSYGNTWIIDQMKIYLLR